MISLMKIILSYCKNDITEAEKILQQLKEDALNIEEDTSSEEEEEDEEDSDFTSISEEESEEYDEEQMEEEVLTIVRDKEGHYLLR